MKYCKDCKVYVNQNLDNCPLCGAYVNDNVVPQSATLAPYADMEKNISYPQITPQTNNNFLKKQVGWVFLLIMAVCVVVSLIVTPTIHWWAYVVGGLTVTYISVIQTIVKKRRPYAQITINTFIISVLLCVIDYISKANLAVILLGIPIVITTGIITCDVMIIISPKKLNGYYIALTLSCIWGCLPQLIIWILQLGGLDKFWLTFSLLCFSVINFIVVAILCWKQMHQEFTKRTYSK